MVLRIQDLSEEDICGIKEMLAGPFVHGSCYSLAIALHRGLGWPIYGLITNGNIWHAVVKKSEGLFWDGRGQVSQGELDAPFAHESYDLEEIDEGRLTKREYHEHMIRRAALMAQTVWPDLPWRNDSELARLLNFARELEELSRKHRIWIRSSIPNPGLWPVLAEGDDDVGGYELRPSIDGQTFFFDRYFQSPSL